MANEELRASAPKGPVGRVGEGRVVIRLAELPGQTLLDERALAVCLGVAMRTIRRMVRRSELPPPVPFGGRATWMVANVLTHFAHRAERAAREAERETQRLATLSEGIIGSRRNRGMEERKTPAIVEPDNERRDTPH